MPISNIKVKRSELLNDNNNKTARQREIYRNDTQKLIDDMIMLILPLNIPANEVFMFIHNDIYYRVWLNILKGNGSIGHSAEHPLYDYTITRWSVDVSVVKTNQGEVESRKDIETLIRRNDNNPIWVEVFWYYNTPITNKNNISYRYKNVYSLNNYNKLI